MQTKITPFVYPCIYVYAYIVRAQLSRTINNILCQNVDVGRGIQANSLKSELKVTFCGYKT